MAYALSALPPGAVVFADANIFIYGLLHESEECANFIERCRTQNVAGVTSLGAIADVCHRLMLREAKDTGLIAKATATSLKGKQSGIRNLSDTGS
jgi:hypothetical protein